MQFNVTLMGNKRVKESQGYKALSTLLDAVLEKASKDAKAIIIESMKLVIKDLRDEVNKTLVKLLPIVFEGLTTFDGVVNYNAHRVFVDLAATKREAIC